jgi:hypothetical protein
MNRLVRLDVRMSGDEIDEVRLLSEAKGLTISGLVRMLIRDAWREHVRAYRVEERVAASEVEG